MDPQLIEKLITPRTVAICPVHVYGNLCDVDRISEIAQKYNLKLVYDAAHAFAVEYRGQSSATFGDFSIYSFHATKVFNTIEGGAVCFNGDPETVKTLCQEIPVSGNENDIYIIGAWGKADSVPTNTTKKFKISINVYFSDGTYKAKNSANFNSCVSSWQFVSKAFDLSDGTNTNKIPTKVRIYLNYSNQGNTAYFDNVSLVKEPAQSYTYDDDGNPIWHCVVCIPETKAEFYADSSSKKDAKKDAAYKLLIHLLND